MKIYLEELFQSLGAVLDLGRHITVYGNNSVGTDTTVSTVTDSNSCYRRKGHASSSYHSVAVYTQCIKVQTDQHWQNGRDRLNVNPAEHPILVAEPSFQPDKTREKMTEILFEKHGPPAVFLGKNAMLSSFAVGRQTSLVVDTGHEATVGEALLCCEEACHPFACCKLR